MKQVLFGIAVCIGLSLSVQKSEAQIPILEVIRQGIKKVIVAVDLRIQRLQNETIWLQNAQKTLENAMSQLKLREIGDWVERQRMLYADYFDELWRVKAILSYYHRVKAIIERQLQIVQEYKAAWVLFQQDDNFTSKELEYMYQVYSGMLDESVKNIDQLFLVVDAFSLQMSDAKRLELINQVYEQVEEQLMDLKKFNTENKLMSWQRAAEKGELETVKRLYGF